MVKLQIKEAQCRFHPCYSEICVCIFHISFVLNQICSCLLSHFVVFLKRWSKTSWGHKNGIFTVCRWCCFCHQIRAVCFRAVVNEFTLIQLGIRLLTQAEKLSVKWRWNINIMWECVNSRDTSKSYKMSTLCWFDSSLCSESGVAEALWSTGMSELGIKF